MEVTRRRWILWGFKSTSVAALLWAFPLKARACMYGTWKLKCPNPACGRIDTVTDGTCQHVCENSSCRRQMFNGTKVTVVCPNGHENTIDTGSGIDSYLCPKAGCGKDCNTGPHKSDQHRNHGGSHSDHG